MKELIGLATVILSLIGHIPYLIDVIKKKNRPHLFTWLTWDIVTLLAFFGQLAKGAAAGAWGTGITGLMAILITIFGFRTRTKDVTVGDKLLFAAALFAILPWYITNNPTLSIIIAVSIDACAFLPTIRKTYNDPGSETFATYSINILRHGLSLFAIANYNLVTVLYPAYLLLMNIAITTIMVRGRASKTH